MPEALVAALDELDDAYEKAQADPAFHGRARPPAPRPTRAAPASSPRSRGSPGTAGGARIFLKREDLNHTGSHKINNVLGQALLTKRIGKTRVIAETGAGQHGVATATAAALLDLECIVYMGEEDTRRQALNVARMRLLGAEVVPVTDGLPHAEGRHQRGVPRLGDQRRDHQLRLRHGRRAPPVPRDGPRLPAGHRGRGARADARADRAACPTPSSRAWAAGRTRSASSTRSSTTRTCASSASRPGATASRPGATRRRSAAGGRACSTARAPTCCRTRTARPRESHSISAGLDYPGVGPEHSWLAEHRARRVLARSPTPRRWRRSGCSAAPRASSRRSSPRTPSPGRMELGRGARARRDDPRQPLGPRRQGRRDGGTLVRPASPRAG